MISNEYELMLEKLEKEKFKILIKREKFEEEYLTEHSSEKMNLKERMELFNDLEFTNEWRILENSLESINSSIIKFYCESFSNCGTEFKKNIIENLFQMLKNEDDMKYDALLYFESIGEVSLDFILEKMNDSNWENRRAACEVLGEIKDKRAYESLIMAFDDESPKVQETAIDVISINNKSKLFKLLISKLKDENSNVRAAAALKLGLINDKKVVQHLINAFNDRDPDVKRNIITAFGYLKDPKTLKYVIESLKDNNSNVRSCSAHSLDEFGWKPSNEKEKMYYLLAKNEFNKINTKYLSKHFNEISEFLTPEIKKDILNSLGNNENKLLEFLKFFLKDKNENIRWLAADKCVELGNEFNWIFSNNEDNIYYFMHKSELEKVVNMGSKAVDPLIKLLSNEKRKIRQSAAETLGKIGDERAVKPLMNSFLEEKDRNVREELMRSLGYIGSEKVLEIIDDALKDESSMVRRIATLILGEIEGETSFNLLKKAIIDENSFVRQDALISFGLLGDPNAIPILFNALETYSVNYDNVLDSIKEIGDPAVPILIKYLKSEDRRIRKLSVLFLVEIRNEEIIDHFIQLLKDDDRYIRREVMGTLIVDMSSIAVDHLINALNDKDERIRFRSAEILGGIADKKALDPLISTLTDGNWKVRERSARALGIIGDTKAIRPLETLLNDKTKSVRRTAKVAISNIIKN